MRNRHTLTTYHSSLYLFHKILHPVLACSQIKSLPSLIQQVPHHQEPSASQVVLYVLASVGDRFCPLQEFWNHSTSVLSGQETQCKEDNKLPSKRLHPLCPWVELQHDHFLTYLKRMDCGGWRLIPASDVTLNFHIEPCCISGSCPSK